MGNQNIHLFGQALRHRCDPFYLGMNRQMADPCFDIKDAGGDLRSQLEKESRSSGQESRKHWEMSRRLHFGVTAEPLGVPANFDIGAIKAILHDSLADSMDLWIDLCLLVREREVDIQDYIKGLSQQQLKELLNQAWREAKETFNEVQAKLAKLAEPPISPSYPLDQADLPDFHAPDLDNFAMDFFGDELGSTKPDFADPKDDILVPLYRTACNFRGLLERSWVKELNCFIEVKSLPEHNLGSTNLALLDRVRPTYLAPHINLQDLMVTENLLRFIHYRTRIEPREFAAHDNIMTYTGRQSKIISGPMVANVMVAYEKAWKKSEGISRGYGADPDPTMPEISCHNHREDYHSGYLFGPSEFYLIVKSQTLTYAFLKSLCVAIAEKMNLAPEVTIRSDRDLSEKARARCAEVERIAYQNLESATPWPDKATLALYEPRAPGIKMELFVPRLERQFAGAKEHILKLFDDPDYFTAIMIQEREHHWHNIPANSEAPRIDGYIKKEKRHKLYIECLRRVSKRALFEIFLWNTTKLTLEAFNQKILKWCPETAQSPTELGDYALRWPKPPSFISPRKPDTRAPVLLKYLELVALIRYNAIFFLNEFRVAVIHASSEPFRKDFYRKGARKDVDINKGHFHSDPTSIVRCSRVYDKDDDDKDLLIDLIDTFIADEGASMHIGIHRVTERLQFLLDDRKDSTWEYMTEHVANTIGKLHILAELADHLERWHPVLDVLCESTEEERRSYFRKASQGVSIDFFNFDSFKIDDDGKCVPSKRINRLCSFLDEVQQFEPGDTRSLGVARGDLKRYACSLLTQYIEVINERSSHPAGAEVLEELERQMGFKRDSFPFTEDEEPIDIGRGGLTYRIPGDKLGVPRHKIDPQGKFKDEARNWKRKGKRVASEAFENTTKERNREEIVERRRVKMQARLQKVRDKWARENEDHRRRMAAAAARPGRPQPRAQPPRPPPAPRTTPMAPDGRPKKKLNKTVWRSLAGVFNIDKESPPSADSLESAMKYIGYGHNTNSGGGSHSRLVRNDATCRWPRGALPNGNALTWSEPHGQGKKRATEDKARTWTRLWRDQGFTWEFINEWHYGYE